MNLLSTQLLIFLLLSITFTISYATIIEVLNNCSYTIWAAATPGGGRQVNPYQTWTINFKSNTPQTGRIWARTKCKFDSNGRGSCETGDCNGLLHCQSSGASPNTLVVYSLNQINNTDFFGLSLGDGFNLPVDFVPSTTGLRGIRCSADIVGLCPSVLQVPGGCNSPCTTFKNETYCCGSGKCEPTLYSKFFKDNCPDAYSYHLDQDLANPFTYPSGTNYKIVFCPSRPTNIANPPTFEIRNECPYTVWAAAVPGGGQQLNSGQSWTINVTAGTAGARIWGRTNCNFDGSGRGRCETGDCGGLLSCQGFGQPPNTLAEYALNQISGADFYDISLVDGFNIPMDFSPTGGCRDIRCSADINGQCPNLLRAPGGCNNPCTVFKTNEYCCTNGQGCGPTNFSKFFKERCPDAYSYPQDDASSTFTCPGGGYYRVVFCP